jgi:hypothetical protein
MALPLAATAALSAAPGIIGMFQKINKTPQERAAEGYLNQSNDYINMSMNPDDPRYKAMVGVEKQGIQNDFLSSLRDMIEANRRQRTLGRTEIFDPERKDESMFSAITKNKQQADQQANVNVLNRINASIANLRGNSNAMLGIAEMEQGRRDQKRQRNLAGLGAASQGVSSVMKMFGG